MNKVAEGKNDERGTDDGIVWNGFECKWLQCGNPNCKVWMSMMVGYVEHEVIKCDMCLAKDMSVLKKEN